jgi:hypothetical protein
MRQHGRAMLNRRELILAEYFFNKSLVSQIARDADQVVVPVLIMDQVNADAPIARCKHSALENAAKETRAAGYQYVLQSSFLQYIAAVMLTGQLRQAVSGIGKREFMDAPAHKQ